MGLLDLFDHLSLQRLFKAFQHLCQNRQQSFRFRIFGKGFLNLEWQGEQIRMGRPTEVRQFAKQGQEVFQPSLIG